MRQTRLDAGLAPEEVSTTFHGRDLFAPASALLAEGRDPGSFGRAVDTGSLVRLSLTPSRTAGGGVSTPVIEIDRFGNVGLGLSFAELPVGREDEPGGVAGPQAGGRPHAEPGTAIGGPATVLAGVVPRVAAGGGTGTAACAAAGAGAEAVGSAGAMVAWRGAETRFRVEVAGDDLPEWTARVVSTYADLIPGELGVIKDSWGQAALALNGASAAEFLGARRGAIVSLTPVAGAARAGGPLGSLGEFRGNDRIAEVGR